MSSLASAIDHTLLKPDATKEQIDQLCTEALQYHFASVCVLPYWVPRVATRLEGSNIEVCTVIGFPLGATFTAAKVNETMIACSEGATEIDMVVTIPAVKNGEWVQVERDIDAVVDAAQWDDALVKVIIETCLLTQEEKITLCEIVTRAGADFIKTSTGFSTGGATVDDVRLLRQHIGPNVRVKASGGIRDRVTAEAMIQAGAARIGTSAGVDLVK
jgi:deoxyribose-phosphate aldolase